MREIEQQLEFDSPPIVEETYFENGVLSTRMETVNGVPHGLFQSYYGDGQLAYESRYAFGIPHGSYRAWHDNGDIAVEGPIHLGRRHGNWLYRPEYGPERSLAFFFDVPLSRGFSRVTDWGDPGDTFSTANYYYRFGVVAVAILLIWKVPAIVAWFGLLAVGIALHELGHYLMARLWKVPIETFRVGLGPSVLSFMVGSTRFELGPIPLFGYVKPFQLTEQEYEAYRRALEVYERGGTIEYPDVVGFEDRRPAQEFVSRTGRILFLLGGIFVNLLVAGLAFAVFFGFGERPASAKPSPSLVNAPVDSWILTPIPNEAPDGGKSTRFRMSIKTDRGVVEIPGSFSIEGVPSRPPTEKPTPIQSLPAEEQSSAANLIAKAKEHYRQYRSQQQQVRKRNRDNPHSDLGERFLSGSWWDRLLLFGIANAVLGLFNLLPFPPLDGARCLGVVFERYVSGAMAQRAILVFTVLSLLGLLGLFATEMYILLAEILDAFR